MAFSNGAGKDAGDPRKTTGRQGCRRSQGQRTAT